SFVRALASERWQDWLDADPSGSANSTGKGRPAPAPKFDWCAIDFYARRFHDHDRRWDELLDSTGVTPLRVCYEELATDYEGSVRRVLAFLNQPAAPVAAPALRPQADALTEAWVERYYNPTLYDRARIAL